MRRALAVRAFFPRRQCQRIERLAQRTPQSVGWELTHWSARSLALAAVQREIVPAIHPDTISRVLREAEIQPHRFRYWKTTVWDETAVERALKILWVYERIAWLWQRGEVVLALDEKPSLQVLERCAPTQPVRPGQIERQEFEYIRHGTVNLLAGLNIYTGRMWAECPERNDSAHFQPALRRFLHPYGWARRIHLILDEGPSHVSASTDACFASYGRRLRVLLTPVDASWLNQAELLLDAFTVRYLLRGDWPSPSALIDHILRSYHEYNRRFAHPFAWHWTRRDFRFWLNNTPGLLRCTT
ncbi:MAG: IS630 family transposase [Anaerolineales bacterium]|nr:IS630 family transposase [Anaerolineales bacterium]